MNRKQCNSTAKLPNEEEAQIAGKAACGGSTGLHSPSRAYTNAETPSLPFDSPQGCRNHCREFLQVPRMQTKSLGCAPISTKSSERLPMAFSHLLMGFPKQDVDPDDHM